MVKKILLLGLMLAIGVNTNALTDRTATGLTVGTGLFGAFLGKFIAKNIAGDSNQKALIAGIAIGGGCAAYLGRLWFGSMTPSARIEEAQGLITSVSQNQLVNPSELATTGVLPENFEILDYSHELKNCYVRHIEHQSGYQDYSLMDARVNLNGCLDTNQRAGKLLQWALGDDAKQGSYLRDTINTHRDSLSLVDRLTRNRLGVITQHPRFEAQRNLKILSDEADARRRIADAQSTAAYAALESARAEQTKANAAQTQANVAVVKTVGSLINGATRK